MKHLIATLLLLVSPLTLDGAPQSRHRPTRRPYSQPRTVSVVVYVPNACDYYIAYNDMGFVVLEWFGGAIPDKGDTLRGDINTYGMKAIWNATQNQSTQVWIEEYWLDSDDAFETLSEHCN